jgi:hypothetical protein
MFGGFVLAPAALDLRAAGRDLEQARGIVAVVFHPAQLGKGRKHGDADTSNNSGDSEEHGDVCLSGGRFVRPARVHGINAEVR